MNCIRKLHKKDNNIHIKMEGLQKEVSSVREERLLKEINTLRKELKCVHGVYSEGIKLRDLEINDLHIQLTEQFKKNEDLYEHNKSLWRGMHEHRYALKSQKEEKEEWIGRTLKFQYLFTQMKKIGLKQSDDIFECFEDIEVPEVSIHIRDKFIPTAQTDNIDYEEEFYEDSDDETISEEDPEIIGEYIHQMENELNNIDNQIRDWVNNTPELLNSTITIQRCFRGYMVRKYNKIMYDAMKINNYNVQNYVTHITSNYPEIFTGHPRESFILFAMHINRIGKNAIIIQRAFRSYLFIKSVSDYIKNMKIYK